MKIQYTSDQQNSIINKGTVYAAINTFWFQGRF